MISHEHRCIFVHIPKCAGTSIEAALGHHKLYNGRGRQDHRSIRMIEKPVVSFRCISSISNSKEILRRLKFQYIKKVSNPKNKATVTKKQYKEYFKFTIVRNPWERVFSWYSNFTRDKVHLDRAGIAADISFKDFLKKFIGKGALRAQVYWLKDFSGKIPMDYIGRFENLNKDVDYIFSNLGLSKDSLPHELKGPKRDFREFYDAEAIDLVSEFYKEEIDLFGYSYNGRPGS